MMEGKKKIGGIPLTVELTAPVKPLLPAMIPGVLLGALGELCVILIPVMGVSLLMYALGAKERLLFGMSVMAMCVLILCTAVARGLLRYGERRCSRRVASRPLVSVQNKVFHADTVLDLTAIVLAELVVVIYIGYCHILSGLLALVACLVVGGVIPGFNSRRSEQKQEEVCGEMDNLKDFVLDSLEGMDEIRQYGQEQSRSQQMNDRAKHLNFLQKGLSSMEGERRSWTNLAVLLFSFCMMFLNMHLYQKGGMDFSRAVLSIVAMIGAFAPILY